MKKILFIIAILPVFGFAQTKPAVKSKTTTKPKTTKALQAPLDGFLIKGDVQGYPDGTVVGLFNGQTGAPEANTTVTANKFEFKGKIPGTPDFKIIMFNNQQPYITLFLDNSAVKITGSKDNISNAIVTGSHSNDEYIAFNKVIDPYQGVFAENAEYDPVASKKAADALEKFIRSNSASYIAPLAVIRYNDVADDQAKMEELHNSLAPQVKVSPMGNYVAGVIAEAKKIPVGYTLPDFSQPDTSGKSVSLSSLRGKYVLIDFWASWCGPCRRENPNVVAAFNKYKDKNFTVLGVSLDKDKQAWVEAINNDKLTWPHISDLLGWKNSVAVQFNIESIPQNFLIDPQGKLIGKNLRGAKLERKLATLLSN